MLRVTPLFLLAFAFPVTAQEPGLGIVGDGTQSQSIELLKDSVSVGVDSAGSVSLRRGQDNASGSVGVSVNDIPIISVGRGNERTPANENTSVPKSGSSASTKPDDANHPANFRGVSYDTSLSEVTTVGDATCVHDETERRLIGALTSGQEIWMRAARCNDNEVRRSTLSEQYPQLVDAVVGVGMRFSDVVAITISEQRVIIDTVENF